LPALSKKNMRENFPLLPHNCDLKKGVEEGEVALVETSGTTDDKVTNIWNQQWWDASEQASWDLNSITREIMTGEHREAILVNPRNVGIISDETDLPLEKRRLARFLYLNDKTDPVKSWTPAYMDRIIHDLGAFQPVALEANPTYLARLSRYISAAHISVFQPAVIVFTYEYTPRLQRRQIRRAFPAVPFIDAYGTTETGTVFFQCEKGKLHQNSDYCRVDFQPFQEEHGGPLLGRILSTPLGNPWSYLLRFDPGDIVELEAGGKCSCGRDTGIILSSTKGRKVNLTLTCSGRLVTLDELDEAMSVTAGLEEYRLVQTAIGEYEVHLDSSQTHKDELERQVSSILKTLYGQNSRVTIIHEQAIAPESSGKYLKSRTLFPLELEKYLV